MSGDRVPDRVAEILGDWYEGGEIETPHAVIASHPELADALREAFAARDVLAHAREAPARPIAAGARTVGDFRLIREIGRGGMGVVYEAEQLSLSRRVALKLLDPAVTSSARAVERFRREAHAAGRLHHPHLVPVFMLGEADGIWYCAMELVHGTTLAQVIAGLRRRAGGPDPTTATAGCSEPADVARACADVADALDLAHASGVVHRDIKPANLILDASSTLKIMDFGLARVEGDESGTVTGDVLGTPTYMSPEQARGGRMPLDGRTDVYSLGATLYEWLTLRPPFRGEGAHDLCAQVLANDPPRPRRLRPRIPKDLETIVLRAMEKDPARRYATAGEMARDLRAFASGEPILARPVGWTTRTRRVVARHVGLVWLGVGLLLAAAGLAALTSAFGTGANAPSPLDAAARRRVSAMAEHAAVRDPAHRVIGANWSALEQIPVSSYGLGAASTGGRLYAISGFFTPRVSVYDPARDVWDDAAPLGRPLQYFGTAVLDAKIYVVGGDLGGYGVSADLEIYDPRTGRWTPSTPMPGGARWEVGAAALEGRLYVVGGLDGATGAALSRVEAFDPSTNRWKEVAPMPTPRAPGGGTGAIGGRLYVAGGTSGSVDVAVLEVYDPATNRWSTRAPLPHPVVAQAAVVDGRLFLCGGGADASAVVAYDPPTDRWTVEPPMIWGHRSHAVAYDPVQRRLYVVGGFLEGSIPFVEVSSPRPGR